jgi:hypothetical protein
VLLIIAGDLQRRGVRFRTDDNAFLWTANLEALEYFLEPGGVPPDFGVPPSFSDPQDPSSARVSMGVFCLTADVITQIFGVCKHKRIRGKLHTVFQRLALPIAVTPESPASRSTTPG